MTEEEKQKIRDRWLAGADNLALKYPEEDYEDLRTAAIKQAEDEINATLLWRSMWSGQTSSAGSGKGCTLAELEAALNELEGI